MVKFGRSVLINLAVWSIIRPFGFVFIRPSDSAAWTSSVNKSCIVVLKHFEAIAFDHTDCQCVGTAPPPSTLKWPSENKRELN